MPYTPTPFKTPATQSNEALHNQRIPPVYPMLNQSNQTLPVIQPRQGAQPQVQEPQVQGPQPTQVQGAQPQQQPAFSGDQAMWLAQQQPQTQYPIQPIQSQYDPDQAYQNLLQQGYAKVGQGYQSPITDITAQKTQEFVQDPTMGRDLERSKQEQLSLYDVEAAQAFERARQGMAPMSHAGETRQTLQDYAFQLGREKARFGTELDERSYEQMRQNLMASLAAGREMSETERRRFETDVGSIAQMIGVGEGAEQRSFQQAENAISRGMTLAVESGNQAFQMALTELEGKIQSGQQITALDFQASQNELQRAHEQAISEGNITAARELEAMRQDFTAQQEALGREFMASQSGIDRLHQLDMQMRDAETSKELTEIEGKIKMGLQVSQNDFIATQNSIDRKLQEAMQTRDINAQREAIQTQLDFDRWKTEAGFTFTSEQNALNRGLELSLQSNDQVFQETMMNAKAKIDMDMLLTEQDWAGIQNDLQRQVDLEIANGNWDNARQLQTMQQDFQSVQNDMDRKHTLELQEKTFSQESFMQEKVAELTREGWSHEDAMQQIQLNHEQYMQEFEWQKRELMEKRAAELTKAGWSHEEAMQLAEHENQRYMQDYEWKKKELMQQGLQEHEAEMMAQEYSYRMQMQSVDNQLQKEIEKGRLDLQYYELAQQASQYLSGGSPSDCSLPNRERYGCRM